MKKHSKPAKQLLLSTEKVRNLQPLSQEHLRGVVGGALSDCGSTRQTSSE